MRDYACEDYGLVLDDATMRYICDKMFTDDPVDEGDEGCALYEAQICNLFGQFTGEAFGIQENGHDNWENSTNYDFDEVYYVPFDKYPSLFSTAYRDINEIIEEFREKIGKYMPEGYDYRANIRHIIGTTFG
jgi:hypothetical protein